MTEPARPRSTSSRRRRPASRRPNEARAPRPEDLWRPAPRAARARARARPWTTPPRWSARSATRPCPGNRLPAAHYLASVVERAAVLATALAASADLLDEPPTT